MDVNTPKILTLLLAQHILEGQPSMPCQTLKFLLLQRPHLNLFLHSNNSRSP